MISASLFGEWLVIAFSRRLSDLPLQLAYAHPKTNPPITISPLKLKNRSHSEMNLVLPARATGMEALALDCKTEGVCVFGLTGTVVVWLSCNLLSFA